MALKVLGPLLEETRWVRAEDAGTPYLRLGLGKHLGGISDFCCGSPWATAGGDCPLRETQQGAGGGDTADSVPSHGDSAGAAGAAGVVSPPVEHW